MHSERFNDQWLRTRPAARLFLASSLLVFAFTISALVSGPIDLNSMNFWQRLPWGILGLTVPPTIFFLYFGMWIYWVRLDDSRTWLKRIWFVLLLIGLCWGSCLYCFCVYLPQLKNRRDKLL